jgi:hypothetical protein
MKTTLDIDDDVLQAAREIAALRKTSAGRVLSDLARTTLQQQKNQPELRNGVPLLGPRPGARQVTLKQVNRLRDGE